jgi:hypothetical protein
MTHRKALTESARKDWMYFPYDERSALSLFNHDACEGVELIHVLMAQYQAQAETLAGIVHTLRLFAHNYRRSYHRLAAKGLLIRIDDHYRKQAEAVIEKTERLVESCALPMPEGGYLVCDGVFPGRDRDCDE